MGTVDMKEAHMENTKTVPCTSLMHIHILKEAILSSLLWF